MAKFTITSADYLKIKNGDESVTIMKKEKFESFNEAILGLGNIEKKSKQINALSVLFDLEGFTHFCRQIDPQLAVPEYLSEFLKWLFAEVRKELTDEVYPKGYDTFSDLPFLSKFMGDGVLFLWDIENLSDTQIMNIVVSMHEICLHYQKDFLKNIERKIIDPPLRLRCGIARGAIYSVGNENDFVGPSINMSARLQKLNSLSFCFSRRGLNPEINPLFDNMLVTKKANIRGIGENELVCVLKSEFEKLDQKDKNGLFEIR
ncbi:hypothetical protein [Flavobacterium sp. 3HN19-14]|uniref:hypothetical protein n=1 Tax=Flavobacterium sp. 3HN19-14 TaxID=3448133 RepID=UPI003EE23E03